MSARTFENDLLKQSKFIGSAYINTGASHTRSNAALGPVSAAGGGAPTIESNPGPGIFSTASVDTPRIAVSNLPKGTYRVTVVVTGSAGSANATLAINDGTTTSGYCGFDGGNNRRNICIGYFTYSAALNNVTFEVWAANDSNTTTIYALSAIGVIGWETAISIEKVA